MSEGNPPQQPAGSDQDEWVAVNHEDDESSMIDDPDGSVHVEHHQTANPEHFKTPPHRETQGRHSESPAEQADADRQSHQTLRSSSDPQTAASSEIGRAHV